MHDEAVNQVNKYAVTRIIRELERSIAYPVSSHFKLRYSSLQEQSKDERKAGVTIRRTLRSCSFRKTEYVFSMRIRIRSIHAPERDMLSHGTHVAILLHELAHLKHMNHGPEFAIFLRDIYKFARVKLGSFKHELRNEIPSPWAWERAIWESKGDISNQELLKLHSFWWDQKLAQ
jgi:predicted metal-dependent hydrolase